MKRFFVVLSFVILGISLIIFISASRVLQFDYMPPLSANPLTTSPCNGLCNSFTLHCSEVEIYSKGQHPIMLGGYSKTCEYNIHSVYTIAKCTRCGSRTVAGLHEHGESDHTYPFICGGVNERICSLDGQVYSITPVDELTPVYEPIE